MEEPKSTAKRRTKTSVPVQEDKITLLPLSELHDFPNHPFKVRDDEAMGKAAGKIIVRIQPIGTIKEMWRFGGQRGRPTPIGCWRQPVSLPW